MKFLQCSERETNIKVLIPLDKILSISHSTDDNSAFIETHIDENNDGIGFYTKETFDEIVEQLINMD